MSTPWYKSATVVDVEIDETPLHAPGGKSKEGGAGPWACATG
jgi:hypothetical protein